MIAKIVSSSWLTNPAEEEEALLTVVSAMTSLSDPKNDALRELSCLPLVKPWSPPPDSARSAKEHGEVKKPSLVLDLDNTLIVSKKDKSWFETAKRTFSYSANTLAKVNKRFIKVRPHLGEFLDDVSKFYDLSIYTASESSYADGIIDFIDPKKLIGRRFYRNNCFRFYNWRVKDLSLVNADLRRVILLDDQCSVPEHQWRHHLPIPKYEGEDTDMSLLAVKNFLLSIVNYPDFTPCIRSYIEEAVPIIHKFRGGR